MESLKVALLMCCIGLISCQNISSEAEDQENSSTENELFTSNYTEISEEIGDVNITEEIQEHTTEEDNFTMSYNSTNSAETTEQLLGNVTTEEISTWSSCSQKPCKNGAICHEDFLSGSVLYNCLCQDGYVGKICEIKDECFRNDKGDICYKGACVYNHLNTRMCECSLDTFWDDDKKECREPEPPCFPNPCQNKGTCDPFKDGAYECKCVTGFDGNKCEVENKCGEEDFCGKNGTCVKNENNNVKFCNCQNGFYFNETSRQCEDMELPCIPNPCKNNGVCEVVSSDKYNCSCGSGHYMDTTCEFPDICYSTENGLLCGGNGECSETFECICAKGYYLDHETHTCKENKEPCFPNPCHGHGICVPLDSKNYNCTCSEGFIGEECSVRDLCVSQGGNTKCGDASCISLFGEGTFYCSCGKSHFFDYGKQACAKIDYCPLMKCKVNEECINSQCVCKEHYNRNNDTKKCEAMFCESNPCLINEMECFEGNDNSGYHCSCKEGFSFNGDSCVEASCVFPELNDCEQSCQYGDDGIACSCYGDKFKLNDDNRTCAYEGNLTCVSKTCEKGSCIKEDEQETCLCPPGFTEIDGNCLDLCSAKRLPMGYCPNNKCESTKTGFRCECEGKYILSKDSVTCETRRFCKEDEIGWKTCTSKDAECMEDSESETGFKCQCIFPQVMSSEGICQDICSFEENQRDCSNLGAKCDITTEGKKICKCPPLYQNTEGTGYCNKQADFSYLLTIPLDLDSYKMEHANDVRSKRSVESFTANYFHVKLDIEESISKLFPELAFVNILNCRSNNKIYICQVELQFQSDVEEGLHRINSAETCVSDEDTASDTCLIPPSLILNKNYLQKYLSIKKADPCDEEFKENLCGSETLCTNSNGKNSFNCTCKQGFVARDKKYLFAESDSVVESCNDVDECLDINACPLFTTCHNSIGSYTCTCIPGYRMRNKSSDPKIYGCVEICDPNPCDHGTCEENGEHDYECRCEAGFAGALCDLSDSNFKKARTNTIIVGAVLGGALLVLIIIYFVTVSRLKKKKSLEELDRIATEMTERRPVGAVNNSFQRE